MKNDPPIRSDGLCAHCRGPRRLPRRAPHASIDPVVYERDPFCSTNCCRLYHGIPVPTTMYGNPQEKRGRWERAA